MKTYEEIKTARYAITQAINKLTAGNHTQQQYNVLVGMSTALQWVCDEGGSTLQRLLDGEPIARKSS